MRPDEVGKQLRARQAAAASAPALLEQLVTQTAVTRMPPNTGMTVSRTTSGVSVSFNGAHPQVAARNTKKRLDSSLSETLGNHLRGGS
jgi:hypothetical protein